MPAPYLLLDPCLTASGAEALSSLIRGMGSLPLYVGGVISEGLGAGLVRRHDALMNYVHRQYAAGEPESMEHLAARTNLFRGVLAEGAVVHEAAAEEILYQHPPFLEAARDLTGLSVIVPDMLYANVLVPGQELAVHTDTPEYRGLSKATVPEWFLVVMHHSGLFDAWRVRIAGGVTFLHPPAEGGAFVVFPDGVDGPATRVEPRHNTSVMLDADELFHGVERVGGPDAPPPPIRPGMTLHPVDGADWEVRDQEQVVARYGPGEWRLSIQWKAHCFASAAERDLLTSHRDDLTVAQAVSMLVEDLRSRGLVDERPDDTALALLLIETYVRFPGAAWGAGA